MEAMSFGIPCVATDVGGTKEVIEKAEEIVEEIKEEVSKENSEN